MIGKTSQAKQTVWLKICFIFTFRKLKVYMLSYFVTKPFFNNLLNKNSNFLIVIFSSILVSFLWFIVKKEHFFSFLNYST